MNWTPGRERPPAGPEVNKQFTVANQLFFYPQHCPAMIEIDLSQPRAVPCVSEKEPGVEV